MTIPILKPVSQLKLTPGSKVTIPNVNWQEFESILQELGEHRSSRINYSHNNLEIMVPLPEHEIPKDLISDLVKILLKLTGKKYQPFGSTTFKKQGFAGIEPDACFYIDNYQKMIGVRQLKADDPPPDLAIETDVTSKTTIDAYLAIRVPEVWIYDNNKLTIFLLVNDEYIKSISSPNFPNIDIIKIIPETVKRAWEVGNYQAIEEFNQLIMENG